MRTAALLRLCLVGCAASAQPQAVRAPVCPEAPVASPSPAVAQAPAPTAGATAGATAAPVVPAALVRDPDPTRSLSNASLILQLEYEQTFSAEPVGDPFKAYGRVPELSLYRDGTVIYAGEFSRRRGVFAYHLTKEQAAMHLEHVQGLGFAGIRDQDSSCSEGGVKRMCGSDAPYAVLRARVAGDKLREIRNYAGMAMRKEAMLHAIFDRIELLGAPDPVASEEPLYLYLPRAATLFMVVLREPNNLDKKYVERAIQWPLAAELVAQAEASKQRQLVTVIEAPEIQKLIAATGTNTPRHQWFRQGERLVAVSVVPWMPGVDHRAAIEAAAKAPPPEPEPEE
jgi:hypothetical protein